MIAPAQNDVDRLWNVAHFGVIQTRSARSTKRHLEFMAGCCLAGPAIAYLATAALLMLGWHFAPTGQNQQSLASVLMVASVVFAIIGAYQTLQAICTTKSWVPASSSAYPADAGARVEKALGPEAKFEARQLVLSREGWRATVFGALNVARATAMWVGDDDNRHYLRMWGPRGLIPLPIYDPNRHLFRARAVA